MFDLSLVYKPLVRSKELGFSYSSLIIMFLINLGKTLFELISIGLMLPIFQFMENKGNRDALLENGEHWKYIYNISEYLNINLNIGHLLIIVFCMLLVRQVLGFIYMYYQGIKKAISIKYIFDQAVKCIFNAQLYYFDKVNRGEIVNDLTTEAEKCVTGIIKIIQFLCLIVLLVMYLITILYVSNESIIFVIISLGICLMPFRPIIAKSKTIGKNITYLNQKIVSRVINFIESVRVVRLSNRHFSETRVFNKYSDNLKSNYIKLVKFTAIIAHCIEPLVIGIGFVFVYVAITYYDLGLGEIGIISVMVLRLLPVVKDLISGLQSIASINASVEAVLSRINDLFRSDEKVGEGDKISDVKGEIIFSNVTFTYPMSKKRSLEDISLVFPSGKLIGLVGSSGSGKSTLIDMIPRLREPTMGKIFLDGKQINKIAKNSLRYKIGYMSQKPQFIGSTILDHIKYENENANEVEIEKALDLVGISDLINSLPNKLLTKIEEGAENFSTGEKLRIDLVRILLKKSKIIILDEPTANLDPINARNLIKQLKTIQNTHSCTIILISHIPETVKEVDMVVVLEKGKINGIGIHEELVKSSIWYRQAFQ